MKLVFCGTPEFAVPSLRALVDAGHGVELVLTQPDRPAGRKLEVQMPAVKRLALERGLRVEQPAKVRHNEELEAELTRLAPEAIVVVAYGRILPPWMLALPQLGCINVHGSLLPKYRGAAPIQWALARGERETGVTTMLLNEGLDTGDMLLQRSVAVPQDATAATMYPLLAELGATLLLETVTGLEAGTIVPQPQDHAAATLAPILTRENGRLDLNQTATDIFDRWRGFTPWPGCWGEFRGKRFLLQRIHVGNALHANDGGSSVTLHPAARGELRFDNERLLMAAAQGTTLVLDEVQIEGKAAMSGAEFWRGFQVKAGERVC